MNIINKKNLHKNSVVLIILIFLVLSILVVNRDFFNKVQPDPINQAKHNNIVEETEPRDRELSIISESSTNTVTFSESKNIASDNKNDVAEMQQKVNPILFKSTGEHVTASEKVRAELNRVSIVSAKNASLENK